MTVSVKQENDRAIITVADTGIGVSAQQQTYVFSKFFRTENAQRLEPNGTGLGLYLTKNIVEHHGGVVSFLSKENKGSVFVIALLLTTSQLVG
ncbi:MAG: ATP-binding protein [Candidatus Spechtbacterales bacterium]